MNLFVTYHYTMYVNIAILGTFFPVLMIVSRSTR